MRHALYMGINSFQVVQSSLAVFVCRCHECRVLHLRKFFLCLLIMVCSWWSTSHQALLGCQKGKKNARVSFHCIQDQSHEYWNGMGKPGSGWALSPRPQNSCPLLCLFLGLWLWEAGPAGWSCQAHHQEDPGLACCFPRSQHVVTRTASHAPLRSCSLRYTDC